MRRIFHRPEPRPRREGEKGQALVLFAVLLIGVLGAAGLLVDGGMAWANRREAQSAADLASLAAAKAITDAGAGCNAAGQAVAQAAATAVATFNGFTTVTTEYPATSGTRTGCLYVRVSVSRTMGTTFSRVLGQTEWTPAASATASMIKTQSAASANCTFCSLNSSHANHTLLIQLGSTLIVDGDIYVNSGNGQAGGDPSSAVKLKDWYVGGDAFDIFGTGGRIQATNISVVGGWETHDNGIAVAAQAACPVGQRPDPPAYGPLGLTSNVCIRQPILADPLGFLPIPTYSSLPTRSTKQAHYGGSTIATINPGVYVGGVKIDGTAKVTMNPGVYVMATGGFIVAQGGSVNGAGVTIYSGSQNGKTGAAGDVDIETTGTVVLTPPLTGTSTGMTIFMERGSASDVIIQPNNAAQCASAGGCIGGISGSIYAANQNSTAIIKAAGTANLQVIAGKLLVVNGATARFTFDAAGFAGTTTTITLAE